MDNNILEIGNKANQMVMVFKNGEIEINIKVNF